MDGVDEIGISRGFTDNDIDIYVCTYRYVPGRYLVQKSPLMSLREKRATGSTLYIINCTDQEKKKKKKTGWMDR